MERWIGSTLRRNPFRGFPRNTTVLLTTEPLWSIPANWFYAYLTLFMAANGLSPVQIGFITSLGVGSRIVFSFFGGHVVDRWGRKWTLTIFDILSWIVPLAIYALATRFEHFVTASILSNLVWIASPAWLCLLFEEAKVEQRTKIYAFNQSIYFLGGLTAPFAGWIIASQGVDQGTRVLFWLFCASMTLMVFIRVLTLRESAIGVRLRQQSQKTRTSLSIYGTAWGMLAKPGRLQTVLFISVLYNFTLNFVNTYNALFITEAQGLALPKTILAAFPVLTSLISMVLALVVVPRIRAFREGRYLFVALLINLLGYLLLAVAPVRGTALVWAAMSAGAICGGLYIPVREGLWQNLIPDAERAKIIALATTLECSLLLPAAPLGGWIYQIFPRGIYWVGMGMMGLTMGLLLHLMRTKEGFGLDGRP